MTVERLYQSLIVFLKHGILGFILLNLFE